MTDVIANDAYGENATDKQKKQIQRQINWNNFLDS
jgi:hypothetical protein